MDINQNPGAQIQNNKCTFTLWSPLSKKIRLHLLDGTPRVLEMEKDAYGYWKANIKDAGHGTLYKYEINGKDVFPDPASRWQPQGVHGPSAVVDTNQFQFTDSNWKNPALENYIIYELHTGTFTPEGTFSGIASKLPYLKELGINAIELLPVSAFPGGRNWGYDGVYPFAVQQSYGGPEEFAKLVDKCHSYGIAVIMDVVYNHLGPEGNYLSQYGPYFTKKYKTPWGEALNFDDEWADGARNYFMQNALMWINDYHVDALRLDAVHAIWDFSAYHIMEELRDFLDLHGKRDAWLIAESDLNDARYISGKQQGGYGLEGQWADDLHHSLHALATRESSHYYMDFGKTDHLVKALNQSFVYDGVYSSFRKRRYGRKTSNEPGQFVVFIQNHDQTGNRMKGERLSTLVSFDMLKTLATAYFASPYVPMVFMGEEYGETQPFFYFISHNDEELVEAVRRGRKREFEAFHSKGDPPDAFSVETFNQSKLKWDIHQGEKIHMLALYKKLIELKKHHPVLSLKTRKSAAAGKINEGAVYLQRSGHGKDLICCFNFSDEVVEFKHTAANENVRYKKILDTASDEYGGGKKNADGFTGSKEIIKLVPLSAVIYEQEP